MADKACTGEIFEKSDACGLDGGAQSMKQMYEGWTKKDIRESKERIQHLYVKAPIDYRFLCGHAIQSEDDIDALDYYMLGAWLVLHRKYGDWSRSKSFDLAEILEFMRVYGIKIPRYIKRTKFYRVKKAALLKLLYGAGK